MLETGGFNMPIKCQSCAELINNIKNRRTVRIVGFSLRKTLLIHTDGFNTKSWQYLTWGEQEEEHKRGDSRGDGRGDDRDDSGVMTGVTAGGLLWPIITIKQI